MRIIPSLLLLFFLCELAHSLEIDISRLAPVRAVGINNRNVAFSTGSAHDGRFQHTFSLSQMNIDDEKLSHLIFRQIKTSTTEYSLAFPMGNKGNSILQLRHLGKVKQSIDWAYSLGKNHKAYGFLQNGNWISGGENGTLYLYNSDAERVASLVGHNGDISALATYKNWLFSGDSQGIMILWNLEELCDGNQQLTPYLYMAHSYTGEWLIWSDEGYFASSENGHLLLSNQSSSNGTQATAESRYLRPDLLVKKIENPKQYYKLIASEMGDKMPPPTVAILNAPPVSNVRDIELQLQICDEGGGFDSARLLLNNTPLPMEGVTRGIRLDNKQPGSKTCFQLSKNISLSDGRNELTLIAENKLGLESNPANFIVLYESATPRKSNLHIAAIAVTNYSNKDLQLTYPVDDAKATMKAFEAIGYGTFNSVYMYPLFDKDVTKQQIDSFFDHIANSIATNDIFVLFIAGHGLYSKQTNEYHFLPYDTKADEVFTTSITEDEILVQLRKIPSVQQLLLVDTCNSGGMKGSVQNTQDLIAAQVQLSNRLGIASLMASSENQVAMEGYNGHGAFTYMVLDGLKGKADYTNDGQLSVDELSTYVSTHLPELTQKKWGFRQEAKRNLTGHNFVLGKY